VVSKVFLKVLDEIFNAPFEIKQRKNVKNIKQSFFLHL